MDSPVLEHATISRSDVVVGTMVARRTQFIASALGRSFVPKPRAALSLWLGPFGNREPATDHPAFEHLGDIDAAVIEVAGQVRDGVDQEWLSVGHSPGRPRSTLGDSE